MRWTVVPLWAAVITGCPVSQPSPQPPDQPGDCRGHAAETQTVEVGVGDSSFAIAAADAENHINSGSQGGRHVWTAIRATGFDPKHVTITLTAVDAFSGQTLGEGFVSDVSLNAEAGADDETCDFYGIPLILSGSISYTKNGSTGGLALVTAQVTDALGHSAIGSAQFWLGAPAMACVPASGITPTVAPAYEKNEQVILLDEGSTYTFWPRERLFRAEIVTHGFASSSLTATMKLIDPNAPDGADPLAVATVEPAERPSYEPVDSSGESGCIIRVIEAISVPSNAPQTLIVDVVADDGHGHTAHVAPHVTFLDP